MLEPDVCWYYYVYLVSQTITMHFKVLLHTRGQTCGKHVVYGCQFFICEFHQMEQYFFQGHLKNNLDTHLGTDDTKMVV